MPGKSIFVLNNDNVASYLAKWEKSFCSERQSSRKSGTEIVKRIKKRQIIAIFSFQPGETFFANMNNAIDNKRLASAKNSSFASYVVASLKENERKYKSCMQNEYEKTSQRKKVDGISISDASAKWTGESEKKGKCISSINDDWLLFFVAHSDWIAHSFTTDTALQVKSLPGTHTHTHTPIDPNKYLFLFISKNLFSTKLKI